MANITVSRICSIQGCSKTIEKREVCSSHYHKLRRQGKLPLVQMMGEGETREQRFWSKAILTANPDKCWEWQGSRSCDGYGLTSYQGKHIKAHRLAWILTYGSLSSLCVLHVCDNPPCINPRHLKAGTNRENVADKVSKNRQARGSALRKSSLTEAKVLEIRRRYVPKVITAKMLGDEFGVSGRTILSIVHREDWRHI